MRNGFLICLFILGFVKSYSQEKWTLQQCVDYAVKNNVSVRQSDVQARLSKINQTQSEATLFPYITGSLNTAYQHGLTTNPTTNILQSSSLISGSLGVQVSYTIFNWSA